MSNAVIQTLAGVGRTFTANGFSVCLTKAHDWHPALLDETDITIGEANATCVVGEGIATFNKSGASAGYSYIVNDVAFDVPFVGVWETQATWRQCGDIASTKTVYIAMGDGVYEAQNALAGSFGVSGDDPDYFYRVATIGGSTSYFKDGLWLEETKYVVRGVCDGTTASLYLNDDLIESVPIALFGSAKIQYIGAVLGQNTGTSGDVILEDIWFDHEAL